MNRFAFKSKILFSIFNSCSFELFRNVQSFAFVLPGNERADAESSGNKWMFLFQKLLNRSFLMIAKQVFFDIDIL